MSFLLSLTGPAIGSLSPPLWHYHCDPYSSYLWARQLQLALHVAVPKVDSEASAIQNAAAHVLTGIPLRAHIQAMLNVSCIGSQLSADF